MHTSLLSNWVGILQVGAFLFAWGIAMLTGLMFSKAGV